MKDTQQDRRRQKALKHERRRLAPMMKAIKAAHTVNSPTSMDPEDLDRQRRSQALLGRLAAPMDGMRWEPFSCSGMEAAWVRPKLGHSRRRVVLYCHGGGFTTGNLGYSRPLASKLAHMTGFDVLCFNYRLAPEHPYPAAVEDAVKAWDYLMYMGYGARDVVVAGDSAGGNLALVLAHTLRASGRQLPSALVLMSPWTDLTTAGRSYRERAKLDPSLTLDYLHTVREAYAHGEDWTSPFLSPLFGDFSGFPPVLIQSGDREILLSDSVRLRDRLVAAGVPCRLEVWKDMWHVFQMFPMERSTLAMEHVGRFLLEQLPG